MAAGTVLTATAGILSPYLVRHFGIGPAVFGWLPAAMYLSAVVLVTPIGRAVDRFGPGVVAVAALATSLVGVVTFATAASLWAIVVAMAIGGAVMAAGNPATNSMVAHHVEPGRQGTLMGIKQAGATFMPAYVGVVAPALAIRFGWRWAALGVAPLILGMLVNAWTVVARLPSGGRAPRGVHRTPPRPSAAASPSWTYPLRIYVAMLGVAMSTANSFYVLYATSAVGVSETMAGGMMAVMGVCSVVARIGWARLGERLSADVPLLLWIGVLATTSTLVVAAAEFVGAGAMWLGVVVTGLTVFGWNAVAMLAVVRLTSTSSVGHASGTIVLPMFLGLAGGPAVFGILVEHQGYAAGWIAQVFVTALAVVAARGFYRRLGLREAMHEPG